MEQDTPQTLINEIKRLSRAIINDKARQDESAAVTQERAASKARLISMACTMLEDLLNEKGAKKK